MGVKEITSIHINCKFDEIKNIPLHYNKRFELIVELNNVKYEFLLNLKENSENLLVLLTSALAYGKKNNADKPIYNRWKWDFDFSTIYCNDPTFYLTNEIKGGFYIGTNENWYLKNIYLILVELFKRLNFHNDKICFYGSSMGGTAALMLAGFFQESIAIADIPILDITNNWHWKSIKKYCFKDEDEDEILKKHGYKLNIIDFINYVDYIPHSYLLMDLSVEEDYLVQYKPFFNSLNKIQHNTYNSNMKIRFDRKNKGHMPLTEFEFKSLLNNILHSSNNFNISINPSYLESLLKYLKARVDIKNEGISTNDIEIINISDSKTQISKPSWSKDEKGIGTSIVSYASSLKIKFKCINDGLLNIRLRSIDYRDKNRERFPIYICYEKFTLNNKIIFDEDKTVTHDKPFLFKKNVKNNEIIEISINWRSFDGKCEYYPIQ